MENLKHGDRVICILDVGQSIVEKGKIYTIYKPDWMGVDIKSRVYIQENKRFGFIPGRFKKVK